MSFSSEYKVYCWTNKINGKRYIGLTSQTMHKRAGAHMQHYSKSPYFWAAIQKYGEEAFVCEILKSHLTLEEAEHYEREYIKKYNTTDHQCGYNIQAGGTHGQTYAARVKVGTHVREALKTSTKMAAYKERLKAEFAERMQTADSRAARHIGLKRMWDDPVIKAKRVARIKQVWADPAMKAHILEARKATGRQCGPYKPVRVYCKETDTTYDTVSELEAALHISIKSTMRRAMKKGQFTFTVGERKGTMYTITRIVDTISSPA